MDVLVSVIIPVHNVCSFLNEALDSIINQTYRNLEIIIVDDGSTDGSGMICDEYQNDSRVRVIHQGNQGLSAARNRALDLTTGDYVAFLDSDDAFHLNMIEKMLNAMDSCGADIVVCGYDVYYTKHMMKSGIRKGKGLRLNDECLTAFEAHRNLISGKMNYAVWNKLFRKELWSEVRFPEGHVSEDACVMHQIIERCTTIRLLGKEYVYHRKRKGSISKTNTVNYIYDLIIALRHIEEFVNIRTPNSFSITESKFVRENHAKCLTVRYGEILYNHFDKRAADLLKDTIKKYWETVDNHCIQKKTEVYRFLFYNAPYLIYPLRSLFRFMQY